MAEDPERPADAATDEDRTERAAEQGAESYGGDPDAEPSVTPEEAARGSERDQAEG